MGITQISEKKKEKKKKEKEEGMMSHWCNYKYDDRLILFEQSSFTMKDKEIRQSYGTTGGGSTWQKLTANGNKGLGSGGFRWPAMAGTNALLLAGPVVWWKNL